MIRATYRGKRFQSGSEIERMRAHWEGIAEGLLVAAREGSNPWCVGCSAPPLDGGLRCLACFRKVARPKTTVSGCGTEAGCAAHRRRNEAPCRSCLEGARAAQVGREQRSAA